MKSFTHPCVVLMHAVCPSFIYGSQNENFFFLNVALTLIHIMAVLKRRKSITE